jgi:hypothetical protein
LELKKLELENEDMKHHLRHLDYATREVKNHSMYRQLVQRTIDMPMMD